VQTEISHRTATLARLALQEQIRAKQASRARSEDAGYRSMLTLAIADLQAAVRELTGN
jgi:hypothetical protein